MPRSCITLTLDDAKRMLRVAEAKVGQVRSDTKSLVYFLKEDRETPERFLFYEIFATRADFDAHSAMPYVQAWFARLPELAEGGVTVRQMRVLGQGK